jgi:hypothetical protein
MTNGLSNHQRIAAAVQDCDWLAPASRSALLNLPWDDLEEGQLDSYLRSILNKITDLIAVDTQNAPAFQELVAQMRVPGALEFQLNHDPEMPFTETLREAYLRGVANRAYDQTWSYLALNAVAVMHAPMLLRQSISNLQAERLQTALMLSLLLAGKRSNAICVAPLLEALGFSGAQPPSSEVLLAALRTQVGRSRELIQVQFLKRLANLLLALKHYHQAQAVCRFVFDPDVNEAEARSLAHAVRHFFETVSSHELVALRRMLAAEGVDALTLLWKASEVTAPSPDLPNGLRVSPEQVLDTVGGPSLGDRWDFDLFDQLFTLVPEQPVVTLICEWLNSLEDRDRFKLLQDHLRATRVSAPLDWWQLPATAGRTVILGVAFEKSLEIQSEDAAFNLLFEVLHVSADGVEPLAEFFRSAPSTATSLAARILMFPVSLHIFRFQAATIRFLEVYFDLADIDSYRSDAFREQCRRAIDSTVYLKSAVNLEPLLLAKLTLALLLEGDIEKATYVLSAMLAEELSNTVAVAARLQVVAERNWRLYHAMVAAIVALSEYVPRLALTALLVTERLLGLPDTRTVNQATLVELVRNRMARCQDSTDRFERCSEFSFMVLSFRAIGDHQRAILVAEAALEVWGKSPDEVRFQFQQADQAAWTHIVAHVQESLFALQQFERFTALIEPLREFSLLRETQRVEILPAQSPDQATAFLMRSTLVRMAVALTRGHVAALHASGLVSEVQQAIESEFVAERWDLPAWELLTQDVLLLARECANVMCDRDLAYLRETYRFVAAAVEPLFAHWTLTYDGLIHAEMSAELRQSLIMLGNSISARLGHGEGQVHRVAHLLQECSLAQREIMVKYHRRRDRQWNMAGARMTPGAIAASPLPGISAPSLLADVSPGRGRYPQCIEQRRAREFLIPPAFVKRDESESLEFDSRLQSILERSKVSEEELIQALAPGSKLLRTCFGLDGKWVWAIYQVRDGKLIVVDDDRGAGRGGVRNEVTAASERFERQVDGIWDSIHDHEATHQANHSANLYYFRAHLRQMLMAQGRVRKADFSDPDFACSLEKSLAIMSRLRSRVVAEFGEPATWLDLPPHPQRWEAWWSNIFVDYFPSGHFLPEGELEHLQQQGQKGEWQQHFDHFARRQLDVATQRLLEDLDRLLPVGPLIRSLRSVDDLVIWPDDILLAVPFPFLKVHERDGNFRYLFETVGTIRTIISPLLDAWMRKSESARQSDQRPVILSLSHFPSAGNGNEHPDDLREFAAELHLRQAFADLQERHGDRVEWRMACGENGRHDVLARTLEGLGPRPIALVAVCGHGRQTPQGVVLADGIWDGSEIWNPENDLAWRTTPACSLENIDFLMEISCSIGRLKQAGFQDVNGFCANLFLNRARSVLAGRSTLHASEGIHLAAAIGSEYLREYGRDEVRRRPLWQSRTRGQAVANVRRAWAAATRQGKELPYGLNTLANLDLFGLG